MFIHRYESQLETGTVKWFDLVSSNEKARPKTSLFDDGDKVEFEVGETEKGPNAV